MIENLMRSIESFIPEYRNNPVDNENSNGGCAVCIIEKDGTVHGKMFGDNKARMRHTYKVAWIKASQVWLTGMKTGEFEKKVFAGEIDEHNYGVSKPDMIGWERGQPIVLKDGTQLSIGFSGFRSESDLQIVLRAISAARL